MVEAWGGPHNITPYTKDMGHTLQVRAIYHPKKWKGLVGKHVVAFKGLLIMDMDMVLN